MSNPWVEKLKEVAGGWTAVVTLGSFALYLLGYLCVRFHLTALGLGTDLTVLDERYLFVGAKFLVHLLSTLATVILIGLIPGLIYFLRRGSAARAGGEGAGGAAGAGRGPSAALIAGIVLSTLSVQLLMKKCFLFTNLLLAGRLPWTGLGLEELLLEDGDLWRELFFIALLVLNVVTLLLLIYAARRAARTAATRLGLAALTFLVVIQFLLLPVNYGVFIYEKDLPRVADLGSEAPLAAGQEAWLVWEGKDGATYLVRDAAPARARKLVTVPKSAVKKIEIVGYDPIFRRIFREE
jgi:hypothetical protein